MTLLLYVLLGFLALVLVVFLAAHHAGGFENLYWMFVSIIAPHRVVFVSGKKEVAEVDLTDELNAAAFR